MKQHITVTQLQELSDTARDKLTFFLESTGTLYGDYRDNDFCEHVNIGRMIEFLHLSQVDRRFKKGRPDTIEFYQKQYEIDEWEYQWWSIVPEELCDDLWEAVKEVL